MKKTNEAAFLQHAILSGYKSIIDVDIDFKDGLNVIIGKNAAGKTNLMTFLNKVLELSFSDLYSFSSRLVLKNENEIVIEASNDFDNEIFKESNLFTTKETNVVVKKGGKIIEDSRNEVNVDKNINYDRDYITTFIRHGLPKYFYLVDNPFSFKVDKIGFSSELFDYIEDNDLPYFIRSIFAELFFATTSSNASATLDIVGVRKILNKVFEKIEKIKKAVKRFSPIEDIRFNENYNIFLDDDKEIYTINNLFLEFNIDGNWHPYSNLSDGTKRLFYLISEVACFANFHYSKKSFGVRSTEISRILLIEEPELGVHPHQLMELMKFLKEESKKKQIILTTHSPQILNIFDEDELDRIIIASTKSYKTGTELRRLTGSEIDKAQKYMEDDYLSDYWQYSDLEV